MPRLTIEDLKNLMKQFEEAGITSVDTQAHFFTIFKGDTGIYKMVLLSSPMKDHNLKKANFSM